MPSERPSTYRAVLQLAAFVTVFATVVAFVCAGALWLVERDQPNGTVRTFGDAMWWALTTMTTTGYGDHIPVTPMGRVIGVALMVVGVSVIGAVAAVIALAVTMRVARQEEQALETEAESVVHRLELRLARIEAQLDGLDTRLRAPGDDLGSVIDWDRQVPGAHD